VKLQDLLKGGLSLGKFEGIMAKMNQASAV
jgi:hypothetical protein